MKLRLDKCVFAAYEVGYLEVLISREGLRINPKRMDKTLNYPPPDNVKAAKSFLGAASYFRSPFANQKTSTIAKMLVNDAMCMFGVPEKLISDRGSNYTSELFKEITKILGTKHKLTTA
ncbi:hypothetical protein OESDEN_10861 [Oesophagostomum dentatum]|uniref:Integrase catalytic domain-containing protein n=1 Tax=Oesophagostomum dentatum TaxID=61180 RepID=A0A0B1SVH9_OESDE|nr:hypothetical protein OESDEN_10861 [Oesophagostomum dentatum]